MKRSNRRQLFNLFAFALLAFAIYLTVFHKDNDGLQSTQPVKTATAKVDAASHH